MTRSFDRQRAVFHAQLIEVARERYLASCSGIEAEPFIGYLYGQYQSAGSPRDVGPWLSNELGKYFRWVLKPPRWVEEPAWPYAYGRPMTFIQQCNLPANGVTKAALTWDAELYLFGVRIPTADGYKLEYRVVEQEYDPDRYLPR